ncbi:MAG: polysaccharide deacetylase family protein [Clostridia bacterium]|nr:polysaccharide deacetylase family protein [Clostridia bacterium]
MNWLGKKKALTFSYDDGVTQDIRLVELFNKYGMKCTFNINSELLGKPGELKIEGKPISHVKIAPSDVCSIYEGHEIAAHTLTHPLLVRVQDDDEVVRQVEEDRKKLSEMFGYNVVGFAYPGGGVNFDSRLSKLIRERTGVKYARTTQTTKSFDLPDNLYEFKPTVHHTDFDELMRLGKEFLKLDTDSHALFYIWGHSYEFDVHDSWERFEEFLKMMANRDDIFYATNKEAFGL